MLVYSFCFSGSARGLCLTLKRGRPPCGGLAQFLYIGNMDGSVDGFDTAIWIGFGTANGFLNRAATLDNDLAFGGVDAKDGALFAFVVTGDDFDLVAFFDVCLDAAHESGIVRIGLENLGCEGDDLHELFFTKLTCNRSEDTGAAWVVVFVDDDDGVGVEAKHRAIWTTDRIRGTNDDCFHHAAFFDGGGWDRIADVSGDDVTEAGGAAAFTENSDHFSCASTGVISNGELGFHLDHGLVDLKFKIRD